MLQGKWRDTRLGHCPCSLGQVLALPLPNPNPLGGMSLLIIHFGCFYLCSALCFKGHALCPDSIFMSSYRSQ